jgi:hypothetical protein
VNEIEVYLLDDSEYSEIEANQKGFRLDVYAKVDNKYYNINIYDIIRLNQEFEISIKNEGYYSIDPNLVLVNDVNKNSIIFTLTKLCSQNYFDSLKPLDNIDIKALIKVN